MIENERFIVSEQRFVKAQNCSLTYCKNIFYGMRNDAKRLNIQCNTGINAFPTILHDNKD